MPRGYAWTQDQIADIVAMRADGYSYTEIARVVGSTKKGIQGIVWRLRHEGKLI